MNKGTSPAFARAEPHAPGDLIWLTSARRKFCGSASRPGHCWRNSTSVGSQIPVWSQRDTESKQVATGLHRLDVIGPTARPALAVKTFSHAGWKFGNSR
jgi:hypothetical protein